MTATEIKAKVAEVSQGRQEFELSTPEYNALGLEVQKELDRNYWRFPSFSHGYRFREMDEEAKAHFKNEEMVIHPFL